jgi:hypothetical protein
MTKYGYGGREEDIYLKAFESAKQGNPTLVFNFEKENFMFYRIIASHVLKIEAFRFEHEEGLLNEKLTEHASKFEVPIILVDQTSMSIEEIREMINKHVTINKITHVFLDRVSDSLEIDKIALESGLDITYLTEE